MWLLLVFLGVFLHAITNHIDNFLVEREESAHVSIGSLIIFSAFAGLLGIAVSIAFGSGFFDITITDRILLVAIGCIELVAVLLYLYALGDEEVTSVTLWWSFTPVFALIGGWFLLHEQITNTQGIGVGLIIIASLFLAFKKSEAHWIFKRRIVLLMLGSALCYGIMNTVFKYVTVSESAFWPSIFWQYIGMILMGGVFYLASTTYRNGFLKLIRTSGTLMLGGNLLNEILYLAGIALSAFATLQAPLVFVSSAENIQPLFVLITSYIISRFVPGYDADDFSKKSVLLKITLIAIMAVGLYLLG